MSHLSNLMRPQRHPTCLAQAKDYFSSQNVTKVDLLCWSKGGVWNWEPHSQTALPPLSLRQPIWYAVVLIHRWWLFKKMPFVSQICSKPESSPQPRDLQRLVCQNENITDYGKCVLAETVTRMPHPMVCILLEDANTLCFLCFILI